MLNAQTLTGLKHREPGTLESCLAPYGPPAHANQAGAQPVFPERPVPGTCGSSHAFRNPTGVAVFLQKGKEARLGHQAQPSHGHPLVSAGAMGVRGRSGTRHRGEGGKRSQLSRGTVKGLRWDPSIPQGVEIQRQPVSTHTSRRVHTFAPTRLCWGPRSPQMPSDLLAMPQGSHTAGAGGWGHA